MCACLLDGRVHILQVLALAFNTLDLAHQVYFDVTTWDRRIVPPRNEIRSGVQVITICEDRPPGEV